MVLVTGLMCLALNIYHEARGEPLAGQMAVAAVTLNRAEASGGNVCEVVVKRKQFSWLNSATIVRTGVGVYLPARLARAAEKKAWLIAMRVAALASALRPNLHGATHYHADYVKPSWAKAMKVVAVIGRHIFYAPLPRGKPGGDGRILA